MKTKPETRKQAFPGQHADEEVLLVFRQHPLVMRKALIVGLLLILLSLMPPLIWPLGDWVWNPVFATLGIVAAYWFYHWVGWFYTVYVVTTSRLIEIMQRGFFNRKVSEYGLDKVQNVNYHIKGFQAVLFSFGDITAQTYVGDVVMKTIYHPVHIHAQLIDILRRVNSIEPPGLEKE